MSPRTGRPIVGARKDVEVKVRFDQETNDKLLEYCKNNGITRAEAIRQSVNLFLSEAKK